VPHLTPLRIALTLPGAASLGAYEAGAMSALVIALEHANSTDPEAARLSIITGASSGALTAVLAANMLLGGKDPVPSLRRAWVPEPSLRALWGRGNSAPLSLERARSVAREELGREASSANGSRQSAPIRLDLALCSLRGFGYAIRRRGKESLQAISHVDWSTHLLDPDSTPEAWNAAADAAIASASHPMTFAAQRLDREAERAGYESREVFNLPDRRPLELWYSDGGLVNNKPLGRCLQLVREADEEPGTSATWLVLVLEPDPARLPAPADPMWAGGIPSPCWTDTLGQALNIAATQSLYEDLRRVEQTNAQLEWTSGLAQTLAGLFRDESNARVQLEKALEDMGGLRNAEQQTLVELVERALRKSAGLDAKRKVDVEVVAPGPSETTEGGGLLQFRGFLAEQLRARDFARGYRSMLRYMEDPRRGLAAHGLESGLAETAGRAARERGEELSREQDSKASTALGLADSLRLARLVLRSARIAYIDLRSRKERCMMAERSRPGLPDLWAGAVFSSRSGARLEVVRVPDPDGPIEVRRTISTVGRPAPAHVHLDFDERFVVEAGAAEAAVEGRTRRLAAGDELRIRAGTPHVNPTNRESPELVFRQSFEPPTLGTWGYVATLAQFISEGRDVRGDLPVVASLALFHATRSRTYLEGMPRWPQRALMFPAGRLLAAALRYRIRVPS
jgi:mannose-6-phosphate isomerase-like protein (cupin superfamily)